MNDVRKTIKEQKHKKLNKKEQSEISGKINPNVLIMCNYYAIAMANIDGEVGGYLNDEVMMSTLYREHFYECSGVSMF